MPDLATILLLAVGLLVAHGANARVARLVARDTITTFLRTWVNDRQWPWVSSLLRCPWCIGFWTAWPVTAVAWFPLMGWHLWWLFLLAGWSVAHAAGRLNHNHEPRGE